MAATTSTVVNTQSGTKATSARQRKQQQKQKQHDVASTPPQEKKKHEHQLSSDHGGERLLWLASQMLDYVMCIGLCYSQMIWGIPWVVRLWYTPGLPLVMNMITVLVLQGLLGMFLLHSREQLHFVLIGQKVANAKNQSLTPKNWTYILRTIAVVQVCMAIMETQQYIDRPTNFAEWEFWFTAYWQFYALLVLRDIFLMWPLHTLFHDNSFLYRQLHKTHHEILQDAQGMHAFHIDVMDLLVENIGAYVLLLLAQYCVGTGGSSKLGIHWFAISALLAHDGALHSVNPHCSLYFNPLLDHLIKPNVCHQLHHAINDGYYLFIPFHHLWDPKQRKTDAMKYNKIFKTNFQIS